MNISDLSRNNYMLKGSLAKNGYDWWWHSFTGHNSRTGEEKAFYIEFFVINPELSKDEVILGQHPVSKEKKLRPSYIMVNVGTWGTDARQLHNFYPVSSAYIGTNALNIRVNGCELTEKYTCGQVAVSTEDSVNHPELMSDAGVMSWELTIDKQIAFNVGYGASSFFRKLNAFEMFWHAEGMKTLYNGVVTLDGEEYIVSPHDCYGYADKNWGKNFTSPWIWISSCNLYSELSRTKLNHSVIDIGGGRPKAFGIPINKKLLINFNYEGKDLEFNFSKPWTGTKTKFKCKEGREYIYWQVNTQNNDYILRIRCKCKKDQMLRINYESPDGMKRHNNLWNGGTGTGYLYLYKKRFGKPVLIDKIRMSNAGCEYGVY